MRRRRSSARRSPPTSARGLSLLELLIALAMLLVLAAVALPRLAPSAEAVADAAAGEVASALRFAREEARRTGNLQGVRIDAAGGLVRVFRADPSTTPMTEHYDVRHPLDKTLYAVQLSERAATAGASIAAAAFVYSNAANEAAVVFDRQGRPVWPVAALAREQLVSGTVDLAYRGASRRVSLADETGRVAVAAQ